MQLEMRWLPGSPGGGASQEAIEQMSTDVPDGYRLRPFAAGDRGPYLALMQQGGFPGWRSETLDAVLRGALPNGVFFIEHEASAILVATATAQHNPMDRHPAGAELGWVAAHPAHRGRRLGRTVCAACVARMLAAGYSDIYLRTDDWRLAAIKTYLNLGFQPFLFHLHMEKRWIAVCAQLEADWTAVRPSPERRNLDSVSRYARRHVWLPDRERRGFSGPGDTDAFGDESLYRASELGTAAAEPVAVQAGAEQPLTLTYTAGRAGVQAGTLVSFVLRGQDPLGAQLFDPERVTLSGPDGCILACEPRQGVRLDQGALREGDTITAASAPFRWTAVAGRRELKVVLVPPEGAHRRLPAPVAIDVRPGRPRRLEVLVPATRASREAGSQMLDVAVTARDEFDNRVDSGDLDGEVDVRVGQHTCRVYLRDGAARARLPAGGSPAVRARVTSEQGRGQTVEARSNPSVRVDGRRMFVGDLHCHDFLSEAEGYPDQVYAWARDEKRLDFVSVVPQTHGWHDNATWTITKYMNERHLDEGRFVPFLGFEWQHSAYGDKVVHFLGGDQPYLPVDLPQYDCPAKLYEALRASDALVIGHHPAYWRDKWVPGTDYDAVDTEVEKLIELWSFHGSSEGYAAEDRKLGGYDPANSVMNALRRGLRLGFTGGSDTHRGRPGGAVEEPGGRGRALADDSGRPRGGLTAVWAEELTRRSLFEALLARRTCALTGARIVTRFQVNEAAMGAEIPYCDRVVLQVEAWAEARIRHLDIVKNGELLRRLQPADDVCHLELEDQLDGPAYYHCRVVQDDGHRAVCSPVWVG